MPSRSPRIQVLTWQDFDDFWRELERSHEDTPYAFDAYDEEVARVAFKAGRESMLEQVVALLEHMLEAREAGPALSSKPKDAATSELSRAVLREVVEDVSALVRAEDN